MSPRYLADKFILLWVAGSTDYKLMSLFAERRPRSLPLQPRPSLMVTGQVIAEGEQLRGRQRGLALSLVVGRMNGFILSSLP